MCHREDLDLTGSSKFLLFEWVYSTVFARMARCEAVFPCFLKRFIAADPERGWAGSRTNISAVLSPMDRMQMAVVTRS
jgi:hypothetical protein